MDYRQAFNFTFWKLKTENASGIVTAKITSALILTFSKENVVYRPNSVLQDIHFIKTDTTFFPSVSDSFSSVIVTKIITSC